MSNGVTAEIRHEMDWLKSEDEWEWRANLSGTVDIGDGVDLLLCCEMKEKAPCIHPEMLDGFHILFEVLGRGWWNKNPSNYSAHALLRQFSRHTSALPHLFYQFRAEFPATADAQLDALFDKFAKQHKSLAVLAAAEEKKLKGDTYVAKPETFRLFEAARQDFIRELQPVLRSCARQVASTLLKIMLGENERAQAHFSKLRGVFEPNPE